MVMRGNEYFQQSLPICSDDRPPLVTVCPPLSNTTHQCPLSLTSRTASAKVADPDCGPTKINRRTTEKSHVNRIEMPVPSHHRRWHHQPRVVAEPTESRPPQPAFRE